MAGEFFAYQAGTGLIVKKSNWAAGIMAISLFAARAGHADWGWVQLPGAATQIAVGANDIPYILDMNGYVEYLAPPTLSCSPTPPTICVTGDRSWKMFGNTQATRIATGQYGYLWSMDASNTISVGLGGLTPFSGPHLTEKISNPLCVTSMAPGRELFPVNWNVPFGTAELPIIPSPFVNVPYTTTYVTGCGSSALLKTDITSHTTYNSVAFTSNNWGQIDTGETQVTQFTVDGSADQVPWILAPLSNGLTTAWAYYNNNYYPAPLPIFNGAGVNISYITDHYVVARQRVYRWNGDAYGNRANPVWTQLPSSQSTIGIVQIAYASALPGTRVGTFGPSNLYMVDKDHNIYYYGQSNPK